MSVATVQIQLNRPIFPGNWLSFKKRRVINDLFLFIFKRVKTYLYQTMRRQRQLGETSAQ